MVLLSVWRHYGGNTSEIEEHISTTHTRVQSIVSSLQELMDALDSFLQPDRDTKRRSPSPALQGIQEAPCTPRPHGFSPDKRAVQPPSPEAEESFQRGLALRSRGLNDDAVRLFAFPGLHSCFELRACTSIAGVALQEHDSRQLFCRMHKILT